MCLLYKSFIFSYLGIHVFNKKTKRERWEEPLISCQTSLLANSNELAHWKQLSGQTSRCLLSLCLTACCFLIRPPEWRHRATDHQGNLPLGLKKRWECLQFPRRRNVSYEVARLSLFVHTRLCLNAKEAGFSGSNLLQKIIDFDATLQDLISLSKGKLGGLYEWQSIATVFVWSSFNIHEWGTRRGAVKHHCSQLLLHIFFFVSLHFAKLKGNEKISVAKKPNKNQVTEWRAQQTHKKAHNPKLISFTHFI